MKSLRDNLYNWLTIKAVADFRKEDEAAQQTADLFYEMLTVDFKLENIEVTKDDSFYIVTYVHEEEAQKATFPIELIEVMLEQMKEEPHKFKNYPSEDKNG
ncbi:hypothetical protein [Metabacillus fastidiosus]|uniref:Uncharacterized protein n=1 Tax=Metabacillus fastidiosus TaxID=1458 RepID=A0ABU6NYG6_9BACI|nr:hypothetical protein [Metabacillus fastidiosus]MED4452722.1 hypothetical protein [Metabacillus fastidiosus]